MVYCLPLAILLSGFLILPSYFYHDYDFVNMSKTWHGAQGYCRERFTDLATMKDETTVAKLQASAPSDFTTKAWLGLFSNISQWFWSADLQREYNFSNWDVSQPNNYGGREFCVVMKVSGKWNDEVCSGKKPFVCFTELPHGEKTYEVISMKKPWTEARDFCRLNHTDLAVVTTSAENQVVQELLLKKSWIGLKRNTWVWSGYDGHRFRNWGYRQPGNSRRKPCVAVLVRNGKWFNERCDLQLPFFCNKGLKQTILRLKFQCNEDLTDPVIRDSLLVQLHKALDKQKTGFGLHWSSAPEILKNKEANMSQPISSDLSCYVWSLWSLYISFSTLILLRLLSTQIQFEGTSSPPLQTHTYLIMSDSSRTFEEARTVFQSCKNTDPRLTQNIYDVWGENYEKDSGLMCYNAPTLAVSCLLANFPGSHDTARVLDVACGSGLVARMMSEHGFRHFVGVDSSKSMLDLAAKTELYQDLHQALLGSEPLPAQSGMFDVVMLVGGLGVGFIPVSVVRELCHAAKPGGFICMTRGDHKTKDDFKSEMEKELQLMEEEGLWTQVETKETDKYILDPFADQERNGENMQDKKYISGSVYMYRKSL